MAFVYSLVACRKATDSSSLTLLPDLPRTEQDGVQNSHHSSSPSLKTSNPQRLNGRTSPCCKSSAMASSETGAGSGRLKKLVCHTCNKTSATKYDPMITCPSCQRSFHDSCRTPPLRHGLDSYVVFNLGAGSHHLTGLGMPGDAGSASEPAKSARRQRRQSRICLQSRLSRPDRLSHSSRPSLGQTSQSFLKKQ